jgi:hypothetical protein
MLLILLYAPVHALARAWQLHRLQKKKTTDIAERILIKEEKERLSALFEDLNLDFPSLLYYVMFTSRRMVMILTLIFLPNYGLF